MYGADRYYFAHDINSFSRHREEGELRNTFLSSCQGTYLKFSGDSCGDPPVPMPNTAVKPVNAESTWGEAPREDRKSLIT